MRYCILLLAVSLSSSLCFSKEERISEVQAVAFLRELIAETKLPKDLQREFAKAHPYLGLSLTETSTAGSLTFILHKGDSGEYGKPATALWCGKILQNKKVVFGFRIRRNPDTNAIEIYHFWTFGLPKGLKVIRGYVI